MNEHPAVTYLSLPQPPRRARSAGRRDLVSVRSKSGSAGPGPAVTDLSLPQPPRRARSAARRDLVSVRSKSGCGRGDPLLHRLHRPLPSPTPQNLRHRLSAFLYKIESSWWWQQTSPTIVGLQRIDCKRLTSSSYFSCYSFSSSLSSLFSVLLSSFSIPPLTHKDKKKNKQNQKKNLKTTKTSNQRTR
jgi:hypothetical protein